MTIHLGHDTLADRVAASIRRHRAGDAQALDALYGDVRPFLLHVALASGLSRYSAEDVVQNTMAPHPVAPLWNCAGTVPCW